MAGPNPTAQQPCAQVAPGRVSLYTRFQQKVVMTWVFASIIGPFVYWPLCALIIYLHRATALLMLAYIAYIFSPAGRKQAHLPGGKHPAKNWSYWKAFVQYFNAKLVKTADLDPSGTYIFCCHPHGILCVSHWSTFATNATGFKEKFPGLTVYPLVLGSHLHTPFHREFAFIQGVRSSSKRAMMSLLSGPGNSVMLVVGGAEEALMSAPGTYDVILNKRKGFVAVALKTGASLVPVLAFGETDLYDIASLKEGSFLKMVQDWLFRRTGFGFPQISGVGYFTSKGFLPKPGDLTEVIGAPISVPKFTGSSDSKEFSNLVNEYHAKYVASLKKLWADHKDLFAPGRRKSLDIVA